MKTEETRGNAVEAARACVGLDADPEKPELYHRYLDLVAPGESSEVQREMGLMSGCGLVVAGVWRAIGVKSHELDQPYKIGSAVSRLVQVARAAGAWVPFAEGKVPSPGDMVWVGGGSNGGVEHVYTVTSVTPGPTPALESVDGGQRDAKHNETILARKRVWKGDRDIVFQGNDPGAAAGTGRRVNGWIDVTKLPVEGPAPAASPSPAPAASPAPAPAAPPSPASPAGGGAGPARLSPAVTPVTPSEMLASLERAWKALFGQEPSRESLLVVLAQWALETGRGRAMHAYNVGNIKSVEGDGHDYTYFACNEVLHGKVVWFYPDAAGCRFRAYRALDLGVADYLATVHARYSGAWSAVIAGSPAQFAHLLKAERYYTAPEESYTKSLASLFDEFSRTLGGGSGPDLHTVLGVQQALRTLGYDSGALDGMTGPHTDAAVAAFQKASGLEPDGTVGPETRKALADALAKHNVTTHTQ